MWIQSDHLMYTISIIVSGKSERGRGFYRFNNSLLSDSVFNEKVIEILNKDERCSDLSINFDCKKAQIRGLAIKRSSELRKNRDKELNNLYKHASQYEHDPHNHTAQAKQDETLQKIKNIEESIEQCNFYKRCIAEENPEQANINLARLEISKSVHGVECLLSNSSEITDQEEILNLCREYYKDLFTERQVDPFKIDDEYINKIDENDRIKLEQDIVEDEIEKALFQMYKNKSPSTDSLTAEFYMHFWPYIKKYL